MTPSSARWLAWSIGGLSIALMLGAVAIMLVDRHVAFPPEHAGWSTTAAFDLAAGLGTAVIGIVLASRLPSNPIGWMFLVAAAALGLGSFGAEYSAHAILADPGSLPAGTPFYWVSSWSWPVAVGALPFLFLLFPTGHLPSPRWRPVAWLAAVSIGLLTATVVVYTSGTSSEPFGPSEPVTGFVAAAQVAFAVILPVLFVASFLSLTMRYRASRGDERLQLKWFVTAAALVAVTFIVQTFYSTAGMEFLVDLSLLFLWAAIGIAILKYRLYEIDVVINRAVVYATLAVFITVVYVGVVVGVGGAVGNQRSPWLSAVAAAIVAVAFQPVRQWARRLADRVVYGRRATPYEVLSDFTERISGAYSSEDVLPRMAQIVAAGTGADRATIWLRVGNELEVAATSDGGPVVSPLRVAGDALPAMVEPGSAFPVEHQGSLLGAISVRMPARESLGPTEERLITDVASQAGLVLSNVRLVEELRSSRQRLVAAQDQERRRLERDIHDGAQQELVALAIKQRLLAELLERDPGRAQEMLSQIQADTTGALENLRDLARGIYPPLLADKGLAAALRAQAPKAAVAVTVEADGIGRYPQEVEAAVYFCVLEALQNVAKYANATSASVRLRTRDNELAFEVADDGDGFDPQATTRGSGLQNMADRLAALGGSLDVRSAPGAGTTVEGRMPATEVREQHRRAEGTER
jgi:signal transduction histidine kinase